MDSLWSSWGASMGALYIVIEWPKKKGMDLDFPNDLKLSIQS